MTMEGFKHYTDKPILNEEDLLRGKWAAALRQWKSDHGASGQSDK